MQAMLAVQQPVRLVTLATPPYVSAASRYNSLMFLMILKLLCASDSPHSPVRLIIAIVNMIHTVRVTLVGTSISVQIPALVPTPMATIARHAMILAALVSMVSVHRTYPSALQLATLVRVATQINVLARAPTGLPTTVL